MTKQKLLTIINITLGSLIVFYIIYRRFIFTRLPKSLWIMNYITFEIRYNVIITVSIGLIVSFIVLYQSLRTIMNKESNNNIITQTLKRFNDFVDQALFETYNFLLEHIPDSYHKISTFAYYFYETFSKYPETFFIFLLYIIRVIILISFLIDVFIYFKLYYMYKALYLLCISLFIKLIIYVLKDFAKNLDIAKSYLIIKPIGIDEITQLPITEYSLNPEHSDVDLHYHIGQYILCNKVSGYFDMYDRYHDFFSPYFKLFLYLIYLISWCYITFVWY